MRDEFTSGKLRVDRTGCLLFIVVSAMLWIALIAWVRWLIP